MIGPDIDIAACETHLKNRHANSCVDIDSYSLFRRDRLGRKGGGVPIYARRSLAATECATDIDRVYEVLWINAVRNQTADLLAYIEDTVLRIQQDFPASHVVLAGDLNAISDSEIVIRAGTKSLVTQPTRRNSNLDRLYVTNLEYDGIMVITSRSLVVPRPHLSTVGDRSFEL